MSYTNPQDSTEVRIENGLVLFDSYQQYKQQAEAARDYLMSLEVVPESEQECKRTVATARKISDRLNQEKIRVKKAILEPYTEYESQVKEIIGIITEGENVARDKLKALEDKRKEDKKEAIRRIWEARAGSFEACMYLGMDSFLQDRHLNKTVSISEVEKDMVQFMTQKTQDILFLQKQPLKDEYITEYLECMDPLAAMERVNKRHESAKARSTEPYMLIRITGKADMILAKQLLKDINYKVLEENE